MAATLILSQRIEIGSRQSASIDVPANARKCNVRGVLSEVDARNPLAKANFFVEFWDGLQWTPAASVAGWVGADPKPGSEVAGRPGVDGLSWDVNNPPQKIRCLLDSRSAVLMGAEVEFFDADGVAL